MKTENQKRHPAEGVQNVCCLFSFDYVNGDTSLAVKSTGQVVPPLGKPLQLPPSNESSLLPQISMYVQMPLRLSFPSYDSGHTEWANKEVSRQNRMIPCCRQHTSRLSHSRTAKVSNSPSKGSKLVFRSQHNNIQIIAFLSALWLVFFSVSCSSSPKGNVNFFWIKGDGWKCSFCDVSHNEGKEISWITCLMHHMEIEARKVRLLEVNVKNTNHKSSIGPGSKTKWKWPRKPTQRW